MTFEEAINYPRNREDAIRTILIGGVLSLLGVLLVPAVIVLGYLMRALRLSIEGETEPPEFDEWGDLLVEGIKAIAIAIVYFLIPTIVFAVSVGGIAITAIATGDVPAAAIASSIAGFFLSFLLFLLAWYILPAALANAAHEERLGAGFALGQIRPVLFHGTYAMNWLLALAIFIAASIVVGILGAVPPLGFVAGGFVFFYVDVVAFNLYGRAFAAAATGEETADTPAGQPAA